jgi:Tfp pilus assembly protein PilO
VMKHSRKDITLMIAMGAMVLFAAYWFLLKPQSSSLAAARSERQSVEQSISAAQLALQTPLDTTPVLGGDAATFAVAVPADPAIPTLLRQLQAIATDTGALQGSIAPTPVAANLAGPGGTLQITISVSGTHDATQAYLLRLRDLKRLFIVDQLSVTSSADGAEQLQISGRVFTRQTPFIAPAATTPVSTP